MREQLDAKLAAAGISPSFHGGVRITDEITMKFLMEASGSARFEIESSLARGFRGRPGQSGINVVSGNFLYSAKPLGVRDAIDFMYEKYIYIFKLLIKIETHVETYTLFRHKRSTLG